MGTRGRLVRAAGMPRLPLGVRRQGHVGTRQGLSPATTGLGGANPRDRERKSRGTVCDVATPAGLGHSRLPPTGSGDPCPPGPGPQYLGRIGRSRRWRRGGDPARPLGAPAPTSAPARTSLPSALDPRACACAQRTVPPRPGPGSPLGAARVCPYSPRPFPYSEAKPVSRPPFRQQLE